VDIERPDYQKAIDEALLLVNTHHHRLLSHLQPEIAPPVQPLPLDQLRQGRMGRDLSKLSAIARGETREVKDRVLEAIDSVLQILFWPPGSDGYQVPRSFWETELGRMISMAKFRSYEPTELVSIGNAASQLGVTRPTIYRWMDDRTLGYVRDEMSGRTFVVRDDVESLRREGSEQMLDAEP
jgi:excisionase family DNA binding protein